MSENPIWYQPELPFETPEDYEDDDWGEEDEDEPDCN
jgi:hypothetical protein